MVPGSLHPPLPRRDRRRLAGTRSILDTGRDALQRVPMREPLRGTRAHVEELLESCEDAAALVDRLQG